LSSVCRIHSAEDRAGGSELGLAGTGRISLSRMPPRRIC